MTSPLSARSTSQENSDSNRSRVDARDIAPGQPIAERRVERRAANGNKNFGTAGETAPNSTLYVETAYERLRREARPYAEADVAAREHPARFNAADIEHAIQGEQAAYASTAVTRGETIEQVAARHSVKKGLAHD
jgi:hypothetical protein